MVCLPVDDEVPCLVVEVLPDDFDAVVLPRETELPPTVPRPVLLLEPTALLAVVFSAPVYLREHRYIVAISSRTRGGWLQPRDDGTLYSG